MKNKIEVNAHSSICINDTIYIDPYKIEKDVHNAKIILFTHSHFDHYSKEDYEKVISDDTTIVMPRSMSEKIENHEVIYMEPNEKKKILGIDIWGIPAYNIDKPMHPYSNKWLGYLLEINGEKIYVCGDTDKIKEGMMVKCDVVCVPIGGTYTMNYEEAASFVNEICPKVVIPVHYGMIVGDMDDAKKFKDLVNKDILVIEKIK